MATLQTEHETHMRFDTPQVLYVNYIQQIRQLPQLFTASSFDTPIQTVIKKLDNTDKSKTINPSTPSKCLFRKSDQDIPPPSELRDWLRGLKVHFKMKRETTTILPELYQKILTESGFLVIKVEFKFDNHFGRCDSYPAMILTLLPLSSLAKIQDRIDDFYSCLYNEPFESYFTSITEKFSDLGLLEVPIFNSIDSKTSVMIGSSYHRLFSPELHSFFTDIIKEKKPNGILCVFSIFQNTTTQEKKPTSGKRPTKKQTKTASTLTGAIFDFFRYLITYPKKVVLDLGSYDMPEEEDIKQKYKDSLNKIQELTSRASDCLTNSERQPLEDELSPNTLFFILLFQILVLVVSMLFFKLPSFKSLFLKRGSPISNKKLCVALVNSALDEKWEKDPEELITYKDIVIDEIMNENDTAERLRILGFTDAKVNDFASFLFGKSKQRFLPALIYMIHLRTREASEYFEHLKLDKLKLNLTRACSTRNFEKLNQAIGNCAFLMYPFSDPTQMYKNSYQRLDLFISALVSLQDEEWINPAFFMLLSKHRDLQGDTKKQHELLASFASICKQNKPNDRFIKDVYVDVSNDFIAECSFCVCIDDKDWRWPTTRENEDEFLNAFRLSLQEPPTLSKKGRVKTKK
jgi:hypothetical protein